MTFFNLLLSTFDLAGDHRADDGVAVFQSRPLHDSFYEVTGEQPHQFVVQRDKEATGSLVALTTGSPSQLQVDAAGVVPLCSDNVQAAQFLNLLCLDLHAAAFGNLIGQLIPFGLRDFQP